MKGEKVNSNDSDVCSLIEKIASMNEKEIDELISFVVQLAYRHVQIISQHQTHP